MNLSDRSFEAFPVPHVIFGVGSATAQLGMQIQMLGKSNAMIVTDKGLMGTGIIDQLVDALKGQNIETIVFDGVEANPTRENVAAGAEMLRTVKDAVVLSVGGGSAMDCAKAIALAGPNNCGADDLQFGCQPEHPANDIIAIPTTSGTGSETNMYGLITNTETHRKVLIAHPTALAKVCILDPQLTVGKPPYVTATCGMDVLTHAIEAYVAHGACPYSDGQALQAISLTVEWLPQAFDDGSNIEARANMHMASHLAAVAFNTAGLGIAHAMGHPLSAHYGAAHGQTLAIVLPTIMEYNMDVCESRYAEVGLAMGVGSPGASDAENAAAAVQAVGDLSARVGTNKSLSELGASKDDIPQLAMDASMDLINMTTPKPAGTDEFEAMYAKVL